MTDTAKLITFGKGGDTVELGRYHNISGYGNPDNPHAADLSNPEIQNGCPVIDKRPAVETPDGIAMAFMGPMVNVDLPCGAVDKLIDTTDNLMCKAMKSDDGNGFGGLIRTHEDSRAKNSKYGPLDFVDVATYIELWRSVGARIGHVQNGEFIWE